MAKLQALNSRVRYPPNGELSDFQTKDMKKCFKWKLEKHCFNKFTSFNVQQTNQTNKQVSIHLINLVTCNAVETSPDSKCSSNLFKTNPLMYTVTPIPSFRLRDNSVHLHECSPFWVGIFIICEERNYM